MRQLEPILVNVNEAAAMLRLSRATLYKLLNSGAVRAVKSGHRTLVPKQALQEYADLLAAYEQPTRAGGKVKSAPKSDGEPVPNRMLRMKAVMSRTGLGRTTIYLRSADGTFPTKIPLGGQGVGWRETDIEAWIADPANYRAMP